MLYKKVFPICHFGQDSVDLAVTREVFPIKVFPIQGGGVGTLGIGLHERAEVLWMACASGATMHAFTMANELVGARSQRNHRHGT